MWATLLAALLTIAAASGHAASSVADEISKLGSLLEQGLLTRDEFQQAKASLIQATARRTDDGAKIMRDKEKLDEDRLCGVVLS